MSVYLREVDVCVGALVLLQDPFSLEPLVAVVVDATVDYNGFIKLLLPDGRITQANRMYLRRVPDESR